MILFYLITIVALLPYTQGQEIMRDPLCQNKVCPAGQVCRHFKPCGQLEECAVTAICTTTQAMRGGCRFGDPVLYRNKNGTEEDLTCHPAAPCPSNAYCSTQLQDISAVCCLSDPALTFRDDINCPVPIADPGRYWCVDECKSDGDCSSIEKCCHTGCSRECVYTPTPPPIPTPAAPIPLSGDPCEGQVCPPGQSCRHLKNCGPNEDCLVTAKCTATRAMRGGCKFGDPVLHNKGGTEEDLTCHTAAPCPSNAYCSTMLQDISAVCCLSDPAKTQRDDMMCPVLRADPGKFWCVDECKSDGDCGSMEKCCNTGCSLECVYTPTPPPIPTPAAPISFSSDPCAGLVCPPGKICRHYKACGLRESCNITTLCTEKKSSKEGCMHGSPVLYNNNGRAEMLSCWQEAPCPSNAYCSTMLMDVSSRCCLADPAKSVKLGTCPAPTSDLYGTGNRFTCYDRCKYDGDCHGGMKCCNTGCHLDCVRPDIPPPVPIAPKTRSNDPCDDMTCPRGKVCRHFKACGLKEKCPVTAICTARRTGMGGCMHGSPVLYNNGGREEMLTCWREGPCPSNAYCSTLLMDVSSRCCLADPAQSMKPGYCPAPRGNTNPIFCYDECKYDGDCGWDSKCCNTGCKMECVSPLSVETIPTPPPPSADPCDNKLCPANMYCRRRGQPCLNGIWCGPEGSCIRCPFLPIPRVNVGYKIVQGPSGCPTFVSSGPSTFGRSRRPMRISPLTYLLFNDFFNKK